MTDLEMRFTGDEITAYRRLHIIRYVMFATLNIGRKEFLVFVGFHSEDLPSIKDQFMVTPLKKIERPYKLAKFCSSNSKNGRLPS